MESLQLLRSTSIQLRCDSRIACSSSVPLDTLHMLLYHLKPHRSVKEDSRAVVTGGAARVDAEQHGGCRRQQHQQPLPSPRRSAGEQGVGQQGRTKGRGSQSSPMIACASSVCQAAL